MESSDITNFVVSKHPYLIIMAPMLDGSSDVAMKIRYSPTDGSFYMEYVPCFTNKKYKCIISSKEGLINLIELWFKGYTAGGFDIHITANPEDFTHTLTTEHYFFSITHKIEKEPIFISNVKKCINIIVEMRIFE